MNKYTSFTLVTMLAFLSACGGGSSSPTTPAQVPTAVDGLDGADDVATNGYFVKSFDQPIDCSTITDLTFFLQAALESDDVCDSSDTERPPLDAELECSSNSVNLYPSEDLESGTTYLLCIMPDIKYAGGESIEEESYGFTTEGENPEPETLSISSVTKYDAGVNTALAATYSGDRLSGTTADATFTVTFNKEMDDTTMTTGTTDNIMLSCNGEAQTATVAATDTDKKIWTVTPSADLLGYSDCTLTIGTSVKDAAGNALAEAATYAFNTQCSTGDDFWVDTLGFADAIDFGGNCWTYKKFGDGDPVASSTSFTIETLGQDLLFTAPADSEMDKYHGIFKDFDAGSFTATLELVGMSTGGGIGCYLYAYNLSDITKNTMAKFATGSNCVFLVNGDPGDPTPDCGTDTDITPTTPFYLQLIKDGTIASAKYGASLSELTNIEAFGGGMTADVNLGDAYQVGILCESNVDGDFVRIGSFTVEGATATGPEMQY